MNRKTASWTLLLLFFGSATARPVRSAPRLEPAVVRVSLENEPTTLDWHRHQSAADRYLISYLMRGLLKYDASLQLVCDLCKTFQVSADGKSYTFQLKDDEQWSDGIVLEAQHFADGLKRSSAPALSQVEVKIENPRRFQLVLSEPSALFAHLLTTADALPIRKELIKGSKDRGAEHAQVAVLGPYQLAEWLPGKRLVIEGNPSFKGTRPVYRVVFSIGPHAEQKKNFLAKKLDILGNPTTEDLIQIRGHKLQVSPYWATRSLVINSQKLSNVHLRRAILYSLDRETLPGFLKNGERAVTGLVPPGLAGHRELPLVTRDLNQAKNERGALGSKPLTFTLLVREQDTEKSVAQWLESRLAQIDIRLKVDVQSEAAYLRRLSSGKFDLALHTLSFDIASPIRFLMSFQTGSPNGFSKWANVGFDSLVGQFAKEKNPSEINNIIDQLTQVLETQEVPVIPLGYPTQAFLLGPRVTSFAVTPFGDPDLVKIQIK